MTHGRVRQPALVAARLLAGMAITSALLACTPTGPSDAPSQLATAPAAEATALASEPAETPGAVETPAGSADVGAPACTLADLKASHGIVEGAAGSAQTEVVLVSAETCSVEAFPTLGLRDANEAPLVGTPSAGPGATDLVAGLAYRSAVRLANWCAPEPTFPLSLVVRIGGDELAVTGSSFPEEGDLPPCNGDVGPTLEGTAWETTP